MPKFFLSLVMIICFSVSWGQSQQEKLEQRKAAIQKEIRDNESILKSLKSKEKSAMNLYLIQKNKIALKEKLILNTEKQKRAVENNMYVNQLKINKLSKELQALKKDYAEKILKSYKSRSEQSQLMFILSSETFMQAYKRLQYLKQYTNFRKVQGEDINAKSTELIALNKKLKVQKVEKQKLIAENEQEKVGLVEEKLAQEKLVQEIKKDKKNIVADIKKKQTEFKRVDDQINRLIREAIAEANRKAAAEKAKLDAQKAAAAAAKATTTTTKKTDTKSVVKTAEPAATTSTTASSSKINLTPEAKLIADNFKANKGHLPWPVDKGFISLGYGNQAHPIYSTLVIHNSGVEITTEEGADARAVFEGEVSSVIILSPVNKAVMIQHGDYFTVYQNLSSVSVSKGDKVSLKQSIGKIRTNGDTGKTVIKFLLLQNTIYTDPQTWLTAK
jgi:murein hydrolase activator